MRLYFGEFCKQSQLHCPLKNFVLGTMKFRIEIIAPLILTTLCVCMEATATEKGKKKLYDPESSDDIDSSLKKSKSLQNDPGNTQQKQTQQAVGKDKSNCGVTRHITTSSVKTKVCGETKKLFLIYKSYDEDDLSPPWSYRGINGPEYWHTLDTRLFNYLPHSKTKTNSHLQSKPDVDIFGHVPSFMRFNGYLSDSFCDGPMPSPINIDTSKAKLKDSLNEFEYTNLETKYAIVMYFPEDGTNLLKVRLKGAWGLEQAPCISKGSVTGSHLCFDRLFIRYGINETHGSEHQLNNNTFGMEFQFFFTHQESTQRLTSEFFYSGLNEYLHSGPNDKLKVKGKLVRALSVFVNVVDGIETEPNMHILAQLAKLFWTRHNKKKIRSFSTQEKLFQFKPFFPDSTYYCYKGSLTFPPCFPDLDWTIFEKPIEISLKDFESFLFIPSEFDDTGYVAGNSRPLDSIYVQLEDKKVNKDPDKRAQILSQRVNREIVKSLPPQDSSKENQYDYYEDDNDSSTYLFNGPWTCLIDFLLLTTLIILQ